MLPSRPCCARTRPPILVVLALAALTALFALALTALLAGALAACGGVEGTYEMTEGENVMKDLTLTLDGGEFTLSGPNPAEGADIEFKGMYSVEGDKVALDMDTEAEPRWCPNGALS